MARGTYGSSRSTLARLARAKELGTEAPLAMAAARARTRGKLATDAQSDQASIGRGRTRSSRSEAHEGRCGWFRSAGTRRIDAAEQWRWPTEGDRPDGDDARCAPRLDLMASDEEDEAELPWTEAAARGRLVAARSREAAMAARVREWRGGRRGEGERGGRGHVQGGPGRALSTQGGVRVGGSLSSRGRGGRRGKRARSASAARGGRRAAVMGRAGTVAS